MKVMYASNMKMHYYNDQGLEKKIGHNFEPRYENLVASSHINF